METQKYNKVVDKVLEGLKQNEKIIIEAFKTELQEYGHKIDIKKINEILKKSKDNVASNKFENLNIALYYSGNVNISLEFMLLALKNDASVTLFGERYTVFNTCIITIFEEVLKELKIDNIYFKYDKKYTEKFLVENQNKYDKIIFIGDYFEYKNLKHYIKKEIIYSNFGFIKGYIDKNDYDEEYQKIMKYCYINNIDMDFYTDKEEFIEEVSNEHKIIIFCNNKEVVDNITQEVSSKDITYNEFPYDDYGFNISEIIKKIEMS